MRKEERFRFLASCIRLRGRQFGPLLPASTIYVTWHILIKDKEAVASARQWHWYIDEFYRLIISLRRSSRRDTSLPVGVMGVDNAHIWRARNTESSSRCSHQGWTSEFTHIWSALELALIYWRRSGTFSVSFLRYFSLYIISGVLVSFMPISEQLFRGNIINLKIKIGLVRMGRREA